MTPDEARRAALLSFGNLGRIRDLAYEVRGGGMLETLWQDLRYAAHNLRRHALLSTVAIITLALGIGVGAGVVTTINAEVFRPQVDRGYESFVQVFSTYTRETSRYGPGDTTLRDYLAFQEGTKSLREIAAHIQLEVPAGEGNGAEVRVLLVTSNFFSLYDLAQPLMGRLLQPEDCTQSAPVVVVSERLWRDRFDADPAIVGKVVHFNGKPVTVVGVAPHFAGQLQHAWAWLPYTLAPYLRRGEDSLIGGAGVAVEGRLNPGFSRSDAAAELQLIASQQDQLDPGRTTTVTVTNGALINKPGEAERLIPVLSLITAGVAFVVLIVCANVVILLLSRAFARRQEIAVRLALGAGRVRLIRMLLTETFLLAFVAGTLSLYFAYNLPALLTSWLTVPVENRVSPFALTPDWRIFLYLTLVTLLVGAAAGLTPAFESLRVNLSESLKGYQSQVAGAARGSRLRGLLIGTQVAMSFVFLVAGGIFLRSYQGVSTADPGFDARQVLSASLWLESRAEQRSWSDFRRKLTGRLEALPGVQSVAYASRPPVERWSLSEVQIPGGARRRVEVNSVSPNFFTTLGIPLLAGRTHGDADRPRSATGTSICSAVVSQRLAREFWPNEDPLGKTVQDLRGNSFEVVGIVRDATTQQLGVPDGPIIYLPWDPNAGPNSYTPLVRFSGESRELATAVSATIREMAPELSVNVGTIRSQMEFEIEAVRRMTSLVGILVGSAVLLAMIGIYGVVSFTVTQRTREWGLRIALGAGRKDICRAAFGSSVRPIAIGLAVGLALTMALTSVWAHLLQASREPYAMDAQDPATYVLAAVLLAGAAAAAMVGPVFRATRVDPMVELRCE